MHIKDTACRHCGASCVGETWSGSEEANMVERRDFACGADSVWHGIDGSVRESSGCPKNPVRLEALRRVEAALEEVRCVVYKHVMDLPERVKQDILNGVTMAESDLERSL